MRRTIRGSALFFYLGAIASMTALFASVPLVLAVDAGVDGWRYALLGFMTVLGASQLASALANWLSALLTTPHPLPRMDFSDGLPASFRSLVVIPTLLTSEDRIDELLESLEVRFLGNRDDHLHFGLLTDFSDAAQESLSEDEPLLRRARNGIEQLNAKYSSRAADRFFLLHRPRRWNAGGTGLDGLRAQARQACGSQRAAARQGPRPLLAHRGRRRRVVRTCEYVITLDTDTQLPRESARQFVGTMAHPLNRPRYDEAGGRVAGRATASCSRAWARACPEHSVRATRSSSASEPGIDPYTRTVSDVYQDLFGEGSFIGKGIYDVDAFERALDGRFPENRILSHDLLEGCYARSGLLSDVHLYEDYPARYEADMSRQAALDPRRLADRALAAAARSGPGRQSLPESVCRRFRAGRSWTTCAGASSPAALLLLFLFGWFASPHAALTGRSPLRVSS